MFQFRYGAIDGFRVKRKQNLIVMFQFRYRAIDG